MNYLTLQYEMVRESRVVLFTYCEKIASTDLLNEHTSFGRGGSIRNLLVHIANTYEFWIGLHGLKKKMIFTTYESQTTISDISPLFEAIDRMMLEFINRFEDSVSEQIYYEINGLKGDTTPLKLFTHVIAHEFHHKGQILSLSRKLGYVPVDTDIMR
jgi:uncharacterized damage-inducible protein DinB